MQEKIKYSKWKATDIAKAFKEGESLKQIQQEVIQRQKRLVWRRRWDRER